MTINKLPFSRCYFIMVYENLAFYDIFHDDKIYYGSKCQYFISLLCRIRAPDSIVGSACLACLFDLTVIFLGLLLGPSICVAKIACRGGGLLEY